MPADPTNIVRATRKARTVLRPDAAVKAAYPSARDAAATPDPGYFDSASDASAALDLKAALLGVSRRRFNVPVADVLLIDPLTAVPTVTLSAPEFGFSGAALVTRIEVNLEEEFSVVEVMG